MITEREFLERARLDRRTLTVWIEEEWLIPARTADELAFTDMDLARANLIRDLRDNMGVNHEGLGVVLHLLDQMHALRRALAAALEDARDRRPSETINAPLRAALHVGVRTMEPVVPLPSRRRWASAPRQGAACENAWLDHACSDRGERLRGHSFQVSSIAKTMKEDGSRDFVRSRREKGERKRVNRA